MREYVLMKHKFIWSCEQEWRNIVVQQDDHRIKWRNWSNIKQNMSDWTIGENKTMNLDGANIVDKIWMQTIGTLFVQYIIAILRNRFIISIFK